MVGGVDAAPAPFPSKSSAEADIRVLIRAALPGLAGWSQK